MATRARGTSGRSTKTAAPPPFAGSVLEDDESTKRQTRKTEAQPPPGENTTDASPAAEVTNTTLQRRELPSMSEDRESRIAERAYWRAERRGFAPGHELDDWLEAEREVDSDDPQRSRQGDSGVERSGAM